MDNIEFYELPENWTSKEIEEQVNRANAVIIDVDEILRGTIQFIINAQGKPCEIIIDRSKDWAVALTNSV